MNDAILIQAVSENCPHINLLKVTSARNMEYCLLHKFDMEMIVGGEAPLQGDWQKVRLIRVAMALPYDFIIWLDADTLIADMKADLRDGCPPEKIGACRHFLRQNGCPPSHLNVGALYISNCETTRKFVDEWLARAPGTTVPMWWEQGIFNDIAGNTAVEIDNKWNATGNVNPSPTPVVMGFHGQGDVMTRFNLMVKALERIKRG
jgi:hypothetical protein